MMLSVAITTYRSAQAREYVGKKRSKKWSREMSYDRYPFLGRRSGSASGTKLCPSNTLREVQYVWIRASCSKIKMTSNSFLTQFFQLYTNCLQHELKQFPLYVYQLLWIHAYTWRGLYPLRVSTFQLWKTLLQPIVKLSRKNYTRRRISLSVPFWSGFWPLVHFQIMPQRYCSCYMVCK